MSKRDKMVKSGSKFEETVRFQSKCACVCETRSNFTFYLPRIGRGTECDVIIVTQSSIYCVECKNFNGFISGSEMDLEWVFASSGSKGTVANPVLANNKHIRAIRGLFRKSNMAAPEIKNIVCVPNECRIHTDCKEVMQIKQLTYLLSKENGGENDISSLISIFDKLNYKEN